MKSSHRALTVGLALGLPVACPVLWLIARHRFDGLYGQDPYAYFAYAAGPLRDGLARLDWPPPFFWPPGYPLLVVAAMAVVGPLPAAGQLVALLAASAVPGATYLLARELPAPDRPATAAPGPGRLATLSAVDPKETTALLAGLLTALTPQLWQSASVVMSDSTGLAAATAAAAALARHRHDPRLRWLCAAAGLAAFAVLTRWAYALVAFPLTVLALCNLRSLPGRRRLAHAATAAAVVLTVLLPVWVSGARALGARAGGGGDARAAASSPDHAFLGDLLVYSWTPSNAWSRRFDTADGELAYPTPNGLFYLSAPARRAFFTPLIAALLLPGAWLAVRSRSAATWCLLLAWPAAIAAFHAGAPWQNFRFTLALLPPLAVLAAAGAAWCARSLAARGRGRALLIGAWVLAGMLWMTVEAHRLTESFMLRKERSLATARWAAERVPPGAELLSFGLTLTLDHYTDLAPRDLYLLDPTSAADEVSRNRAVFLLVDEPSVQGQWRNAAPGRIVEALREGPGLERVGEHGGYTLFRVGASSR